MAAVIPPQGHRWWGGQGSRGVTASRVAVLKEGTVRASSLASYRPSEGLAWGMLGQWGACGYFPLDWSKAAGMDPSMPHPLHPDPDSFLSMGVS